MKNIISKEGRKFPFPIEMGTLMSRIEMCTRFLHYRRNIPYMDNSSCSVIRDEATFFVFFMVNRQIFDIKLLRTHIGKWRIRPSIQKQLTCKLKLGPLIGKKSCCIEIAFQHFLLDFPLLL